MFVVTFIQRHSTFSSAVAMVSDLSVHMSSTLSRLISVPARLSVEALQSPARSNCLIIRGDPTIFREYRIQIMGREHVVQFLGLFPLQQWSNAIDCSVFSTEFIPRAWRVLTIGIQARASSPEPFCKFYLLHHTYHYGQRDTNWSLYSGSSQGSVSNVQLMPGFSSRSLPTPAETFFLKFSILSTPPPVQPPLKTCERIHKCHPHLPEGQSYRHCRMNWAFNHG
jgi:hypothetical protein